MHDRPIDRLHLFSSIALVDSPSLLRPRPLLKPGNPPPATFRQTPTHQPITIDTMSAATLRQRVVEKPGAAEKAELLREAEETELTEGQK